MLESLLSEEAIELGNNKCLVLSLPVTAPAALVDVKKEDLSIEGTDGSSNELSSSAK